MRRKRIRTGAFRKPAYRVKFKAKRKVYKGFVCGSRSEAVAIKRRFREFKPVITKVSKPPKW